MNKYRDAIPIGWECREFGPDYLVIDGGDYGFITIDLKDRGYRIGNEITHGPASRKIWRAGKGWRERLIDDACRFLVESYT